jgi:nitrite reductase/ring-hydroxylating ferredoxin subunit
MDEFVRVADAAQVGEASMEAFEVGGERIAVANVGGSFHAFGNTCTRTASASWHSASSRARS